MDSKTLAELAATFNAFPQGNSDPAITLKSLRGSLVSASSEAVGEAARRYRQGLVPGQNMTFAPSEAEFCAEVRRIEEAIELRRRPRLPAPEYRRGASAPFEVRQEKARAENAHRAVLFTNVSYDEWRRLSATRQVPPGASWIASLATVYGPE